MSVNATFYVPLRHNEKFYIHASTLTLITHPLAKIIQEAIEIKPIMLRLVKRKSSKIFPRITKRDLEHGRSSTRKRLTKLAIRRRLRSTIMICTNRLNTATTESYNFPAIICIAAHRMRRLTNRHRHRDSHCKTSKRHR